MLYTLDYILNVIWSDQGPKDAQNRVSKSTLRAALTCVAKHTKWVDGCSSYPTQELLVEESGVSRASLNRALALLVELGWLSKEKSAPNRSRGVTYKVIIPDVAHLSHGETSHGETSHHETNNCLTMTQPIVSPCDTNYTINKNLNKTSENRGLAATHTREGERACEASQPAAAKGQDLNLDHEQQGQAAASTEPTPAPTVRAGADDEPSGELVLWLGTTIKERCAQLVATPAPITRSMVIPALRTLRRWAAGDEGKVREYLADELDRQEGREPSDRARNPVVLLKWLADKKSWGMWQASASVTGVVTPGRHVQRGGGGKRHGTAFLFEPETAAIAALIKRN